MPKMILRRQHNNSVAKGAQYQSVQQLRHAARALHEAAALYDGLYGADFLNEVDRIADMLDRPETKRPACLHWLTGLAVPAINP